MSLIGRLAVAVVGDISQLQQAFGEAKKEAGSLKKEVDKTGISMEAVGKSMTIFGMAIVGAMGAVVLSTAEAADEIDDLAKRTGISRENLQALSYAAEQNGASLETLVKGLGHLSKNMYEANNGSQSARDAFDTLGISIYDANGNLRNAGDVLDDMADRFSSMQNDTQRTALAMELFGKSGADLIPMLQMGSIELDALKQRAHELGYVIDEESVKNLGDLNDMLDDVKKGFSGFGRQIAADVTPYVRMFAQAIIDVIKWVGGLPEPLRKAVTVGTALAGVIGLIGGAVLLLVPKIYALATAMGALNLSFTPFLVGGAIIAGLTVIIGMITKARNEAQKAKVDIAGINDVQTAQDQVEFWEEQIKKRREAKDRFTESSKSIVGSWWLENVQDTTFGAELNRHYNQIHEAEAKLKQAQDKLKSLTKPPDTKVSFNPLQWEEPKFDLKKYLEEYRLKLKMVDEEAAVFGDISDVNAEKAGILRDEILGLLERGYKPQSKLLQDLIKQYQQLSQAAEGDRQADILKRLGQAMSEVDGRAKLFGDTVNVNAEKAELLKSTIIDMIRNGYDPTKTSLGDLVIQYKAYVDAVKAATDALREQNETQSLLDQARQVEENWNNRNKNTIEILIQKLRNQGEEDEQNRGEIYKTITALETLNATMQQVMEEEKNAKTAGDLLAEAQERLAEMTGSALPEWEEFARQLEAVAAKNGVLEETRQKLLQLAAAIREAGVNAEAKKVGEAFHDELKDSISSALQEGFNGGGIRGVISDIGDYLREKFTRSIADALAEAFMNSTMGKGLEGFFSGMLGNVGGMFGGGTAATGAAAAASTGTAATAASGVLGALGTVLPWVGVVGMLGSLFSGGAQEMTINANSGTLNADYVEANFKDGIKTLSSAYQGQAVDPDRELPAPVISVNVDVRGSVIAERNLDAAIEAAAVRGVQKASERVGKWQPYSNKG